MNSPNGKNPSSSSNSSSKDRIQIRSAEDIGSLTEIINEQIKQGWKFKNTTFDSKSNKYVAFFDTQPMSSSSPNYGGNKDQGKTGEPSYKSSQ